ncbi:hypothetical protein TARUN_553 [Trichoderma arundinaceum]|uniref:Uncharacterized protein n=1 Tax=Trichoderma arundinaceum TaxID=490622 RepID=A0A395NZX9_TRIAR|nr:hypothetical protein TARUN_553 [Trichoderma arundinaceum]
MSIERIVNPPDLAPSGPFSHGVIISSGHSILYTAGQIGTIDRNGTVPESYEQQVQAAIQNLDNVLREAGASSRDIVKLTYYIVDYAKTRRFRLMA